MKSNKEIFEIMLSNKHLLDTGLCHLAFMMRVNSHIDYSEELKVREYILKNRPSMFSSKAAFKSRKSCYYWEVGLIEPRVQWMNKHIKKLS